MQKSFVLVALASLVGLGAWCATASAHDGYRRDYREGWYNAYERHRAAREKYDLEREDRRYERATSNRHHHRHYRDYGHRRHYHDYSYRRGYYDYAYRRHYHHHAYDRYDYGYDYGYSYRPYHYGYYVGDPTDPHWRPELYPSGGKTWWKRMDREGRAGRN